MSGFWMVVVPVAAAALIVLVLAVRCLAHPLGGHCADRARLTLAPDVRAATVPVAQVAGEPPWLPAPEYRGPASLGTWFPHDDPYGTEAVDAWIRGGMQVNWIDDFGAAEGATRAPGANPYPEDEGTGDESEGSGLTAPPAPLDPMRPTLAQLDAMGDFPGFAFRLALPVELPPSRPAHPALERCDWFIAHMRADHERWMASARERWAAA